MRVDEAIKRDAVLSYRRASYECWSHPSMYGSHRVAVVVRKSLSSMDPFGCSDEALANRLVFTSRPLASAIVDGARLREVVGRPSWRREWTPRPLRVLGYTFDMVLLGRCLSRVTAAGPVRVEVVHIEGHALRVIGDGWRIVVAGFRCDSAPIGIRALRAKQVPS